MIRAGEQARLGEILVDMGVVTAEDMDVAISESKKSGERIGQILLKMNLVGEEVLMKALGRQLAVPYVKIREVEIDPAVVQAVPAKLATHYQLMPIRRLSGGVLQVAVNDPLDIHLLDNLRMVLRTEVELAVASKKEIPLQNVYWRYWNPKIRSKMLKGLWKKRISTQVSKWSMWVSSTKTIMF